MCGLSRAVPDRGRAESLYRLHPLTPAPWQDVGVLSSAPVALSRRRFLTVSCGAVGLVVATGCAVPALEGSPDPVLDLIRAAERDAREFAAADASHGSYLDAIRRIADVRRVHAERLGELVEFPQGTAAGGTDGADASPAAPATPAVCPPVDEIRSRLRADAAGAADVASASDEVRAEITGAVSAACTAAVEVLLS